MLPGNSMETGSCACSKHSAALRYAICGALFGCLFPIMGTLVLVGRNGGGFSLEQLVAVQASDLLLWIIGTAPFFLGIFAFFAGTHYDNLCQSNKKIEEHNRLLEETNQAYSF